MEQLITDRLRDNLSRLKLSQAAEVLDTVVRLTQNPRGLKGVVDVVLRMHQRGGIFARIGGNAMKRTDGREKGIR